MLSAAGFAKTWKYIELFKEGLVCTVSLSALTVLFGFFLALFLAVLIGCFMRFKAWSFLKRMACFTAR